MLGSLGATGSSASEGPIATLEPLTGTLDAAQPSGLWDGIDVRWYGSYPADVDGDGDQDVFLVLHALEGRLMINGGDGTFSESPVATFPSVDRHGCAWADVNADSRPDLYCSLGADVGTERKANELWIQQEDGSFLDEAGAWHVRDPWGRGREVTFFDANHDPYPDLYVTNAYPRKDGRPTPNRAFINVAGADFRPATELALDKNVGGVLAVHSCVQPVDYNDDGWTDLLVCGKSGLHLFRSTGYGSKFIDMKAFGQGASRGVVPIIWFWARLIDLDGDGLLDLAGVRKDGYAVQTRTPTGFAPAVLTPVAMARQVAFGDVNSDGLTDAYVVTGIKELGQEYGPLVNPPDLMLLNHGDGVSYTSADIPQVIEGDGDHVTSANLDGDATLEFIVGNGFWQTPGPLQLLDFPTP